MSRRTVFRSVSALASTAVLMGAGAVAAEAAPVAHAAGGTTITVSAGKPTFSFKLSKSSAPAGKVTFNVKNVGTIQHDFSIAGKKTPMLSPGKSTTLSVTLKKGSYAYKCTVPGHAAAGMKGTFKVS